MRIATWNIERLQHRNKLDMIRKACDCIEADILVLTETDSRIIPDYCYHYQTSSLKGITIPVRYADTENRVSIFTKYQCVKQHVTFDGYTAVAVELETEFGNLIVYGTIMGVLGNREASFQTDLEKQMEDIRLLTSGRKNICVIGDYNLSFGDNYYHTNLGRDTVRNCFKDLGIRILTAEQTECIDHIAVTDGFMRGHRIVSTDEWNCDRSLSDHKGIVIQMD